jgi:nicotinamide mononucleotide (NMN) deamidase PncC
LGVILIALAVTNVIGPWGYIGVVPLGTAAIGWCPAYLPFGLKTCRRT